MDQTDDRRRFHRIEFHTGATLSLNDQQWHCNLLDISLKGLLIEGDSAAEIPGEQDISVSISLSDEAMIKLQARLIRRESHYLALECTEIDVESITHLRRLLDLNSGDPQACYRELTELIEYNQ